METNLPQHPCANKCSEFKEEQCGHCLVNFEPKDNFLPGDIVVSICKSVNPILFEVREEEHASYEEFVKCKPLGRTTGFVCFLAINEIRHANVQELNAGKRLGDQV